MAYAILAAKRIKLLIEEIRGTEEKFQDLRAYSHWIPDKRFAKQKHYLETRLGVLYGELMRLVRDCDLWHVYVDKNTINFTFWRDN